MPSSLPPLISTLSLHDALPIFVADGVGERVWPAVGGLGRVADEAVLGRALPGDDAVLGRARERERQPLAGLVRRPGEGAPENGLRSEEHTSELQSHSDLVCRLLCRP